MNLEFEQWLSGEISKRAPDGALTKAVVGEIITQALIDMANIEDMKKTLDRMDAIEMVVSQAISLREELLEAVAGCCGSQVGLLPGSCSSHGCILLHRVLVQIQACINKLGAYAR